jgi:hypothetical protein
MAESFDPYRKWLGIPEREQPPNHYRLLTLDWFEADPEVIEAAADRQMAHVRTYQGGRHADDSQRLLNELAAARVCLLNPEKKAAYDAQLRAKLAASAAAGQTSSLPFGFFVKGAGHYFAVQARRLWIVQRRLAAGFRELGQSVFHEGRYRDRLAQTYTLLESVSRNLEALHQADVARAPGPRDAETTGNSPDAENTGQTPAPQTTPAKRGLVHRIWTSLRAVRFGFQRSGLLERLGREAFDIDPAGCGPEPLLRSIRDQQVQLKGLRKRIAELSEVPPGQFLSPKRLAWIVLAAVAMVFLLYLTLRYGL